MVYRQVCVFGNVTRRLLSSDSVTIRGPARPTKSWERSARMVKNTKIKNEYLEHIRDTHDPSLHLKTLEDELRGTMGKALGKQGEKILAAMRGMEQEHARYEELVIKNKQAKSCVEVARCVQLHNEYRKQALHARWELIVHRQAIGFLVNNQRFVMENYPIGEALKVDDDEESIEGKSVPPSEAEEKRKEFDGQLDWWQRKRWK